MGWFGKKASTPCVKTHLGTFVFENPGWMTRPAEGAIVFSVCRDELDVRMIDQAEDILQNLERFERLARDFAQTDPQGLWDGEAVLNLEGIDITDILENKFALEFGVEGESTYTVTVEFRDAVPCEVWAGD